MKVDMTKLKKMNFDEGKKYLIGLGYKDEDYAVIDRDAPSCDYIIDYRFTNYEDKHKVEYTQFYNTNNDPANDDGSEDFVIDEYWNEVECDPEDFE